MASTIAYTWLDYAGRSAAAGDAAALRYGFLGLGVLAMIAFLPRLFRRFRAKEPLWIEADELRQRLTAGDPLVILDVRQPDELPRHPGTCPERSMCRLPNWLTGHPTWPAATSRSWWSARPTDTVCPCSDRLAGCRFEGC